jgi:hypothetical protein
LRGVPRVFEQVAQQSLLGTVGVGSQVAQQPEPDLGLRVCGRNDVENEVDNLLAHYRPLRPEGWNRGRIWDRTGPPAAAGLLALPKSNFRLRLMLLP